MNNSKLTITALAIGVSICSGSAVAHDEDSLPGTPVCLESNIMMADAQNAPFSNIPGAGRLLEMNTTTGLRGITVSNPFTPENVGTPMCPSHVSCDLGVGPFGDGSAPWKPTGNTSGGQDGHAYLVSAAQHALSQFHRDGTGIMTGPVLPTSPSPTGGSFGFVPRLLGNGFMPNGNIAQASCDANFFNAPNSDKNGDGSLVANNFFPPVNSTAARGANGRIVIIDQETMEAIDEYSKPTTGQYANDPRWNCPAGVLVTSEGLFVSMFHGNAVFVIDWKKGLDNTSTGLGSNAPFKASKPFALGLKKNEAKVIRVIDLLDTGAGAPDVNSNYDSPYRRDNLRAIRMSEDGTLYGTNRGRSQGCVAGEAGCNPGVFRQHIFVASPGSDHKTGTIALDPGVNVIAGVSINRMSGPGCAAVEAEEFAAMGSNSGDACDVETLYIGVSAGNAGCDPDGDGNNGPGHPANQCFVPGGTVYEYRIDAAHLDGANGLPCTGDPADGFDVGEGNEGCAMPITQFDFLAQGDGTSEDTSNLADGEVETLDPRMVMHIHEAFNQ
jgi:hypothetical protein